MKTLKEHKSQIGNLPGIVSTLVVVGILIAAGFFILQTFLEEDEFSDTSGAVTNETGLTIVNTSTSTVAHATDAGFNTFAVSACYGNVTGLGLGDVIVPNATIAVANYTVGANTGVITAVGAANYTDVKCSYTFLYGESAYTGLNDTIEAVGTIPDLLGLIILIAVIGIVLAVIFNIIPGARVSGA